VGQRQPRRLAEVHFAQLVRGHQLRHRRRGDLLAVAQAQRTQETQRQQVGNGRVVDLEAHVEHDGLQPRAPTHQHSAHRGLDVQGVRQRQRAQGGPVLQRRDAETAFAESRTTRLRKAPREQEPARQPGAEQVQSLQRGEAGQQLEPLVAQRRRATQRQAAQALAGADRREPTLAVALVGHQVEFAQRLQPRQHLQAVVVEIEQAQRQALELRQARQFAEPRALDVPDPDEFEPPQPPQRADGRQCRIGDRDGTIRHGAGPARRRAGEHAQVLELRAAKHQRRDRVVAEVAQLDGLQVRRQGRDRLRPGDDHHLPPLRLVDGDPLAGAAARQRHAEHGEHPEQEQRRQREPTSA
jgi:hypothetical protein